MNCLRVFEWSGISAQLRRRTVWHVPVMTVCEGVSLSLLLFRLFFSFFLCPSCPVSDLPNTHAFFLLLIVCLTLMCFDVVLLTPVIRSFCCIPHLFSRFHYLFSIYYSPHQYLGSFLHWITVSQRKKKHYSFMFSCIFSLNVFYAICPTKKKKKTNAIIENQVLVQWARCCSQRELFTSRVWSLILEFLLKKKEHKCKELDWTQCSCFTMGGWEAC